MIVVFLLWVLDQKYIQGRWAGWAESLVVQVSIHTREKAGKNSQEIIINPSHVKFVQSSFSPHWVKSSLKISHYYYTVFAICCCFMHLFHQRKKGLWSIFMYVDELRSNIGSTVLFVSLPITFSDLCQNCVASVDWLRYSVCFLWEVSFWHFYQILIVFFVFFCFL